MLAIVKYSNEKGNEWNQFLSKSKNGLFLFNRDYMQYHSDRFADSSLMIYENDNLVALLPANIQDTVLVSHGGLTFGGFIVGSQVTAVAMLRMFEELLNYLKKESVNKLIYKCIPHIYHLMPAEEDKYTLFRIGARLFRRDVTSSIYLPEKLKFQELRRRCIKKAASANLLVKKTDDFESYWNILETNLAKRHNIKPTHSAEEIKYLHGKFPDNIKLFASYQNATMLAGVVIYESTNVAHAQYIASKDEGREVGALDAVFAYLINEYYQDKKYFDFGISTENDGLYLNEGLISYKEGFGARSIAHDFYEVAL